MLISIVLFLSVPSETPLIFREMSATASAVSRRQQRCHIICNSSGSGMDSVSADLASALIWHQRCRRHCWYVSGVWDTADVVSAMSRAPLTTCSFLNISAILSWIRKKFRAWAPGPLYGQIHGEKKRRPKISNYCLLQSIFASDPVNKSNRQPVPLIYNQNLIQAGPNSITDGRTAAAVHTLSSCYHNRLGLVTDRHFNPLHISPSLHALVIFSHQRSGRSWRLNAAPVRRPPAGWWPPPGCHRGCWPIAPGSL